MAALPNPPIEPTQPEPRKRKQHKTPIPFDEAIGIEICNRLPHSTLTEICDDPRMPSVGGFLQWCRDRPDLDQIYARARLAQIEVMEDEIKHLSDLPIPGTRTKTKDGKVEVTTMDVVERSKLMVDSRKWLLSKLRPDKYGDRTRLDINQRVVVDLSKFTEAELEFAISINERFEKAAQAQLPAAPETAAAHIIDVAVEAQEADIEKP